MQVIKQYNDLKLTIKNANWWLDLMEKKLKDKNKVALKVVGSICSEDGKVNYHTIPDTFALYLSKAALNNFNKLKQEALDLMEKDRLDLAAKVKQEHEILMKEAGLTV